MKREGKTVSSRQNNLEKRGTSERSLLRVSHRRRSDRVVVKHPEIRLDKKGEARSYRVL